MLEGHFGSENGGSGVSAKLGISGSQLSGVCQLTSDLRPEAHCAGPHVVASSCGGGPKLEEEGGRTCEGTWGMGG